MEIPIIYEDFAILTKDEEWAKTNPVMKPGSIIILPEDAVLAIVPVTTNQLKGE